MTKPSQDLDLTGKLLIAMPGMGDARFAKSVVFICAHSDSGAMGLVINQRTQDVSLNSLLKQLEITASPDLPHHAIRVGGPVEHGRGFVLHSTDYNSSGTTLEVDDTFSMTATLDILDAIATGQGPDQILIALGYSGWAPGQLENEIAQNGWLTGDPTPELVFSQDDATKWERALASLGIDPLTLSAAAGRA